MEIIINKDMWKVYDVINVIGFMRLDNYGEDQFKSFNLEMNKDVKKILDALKKYIDVDNHVLKLLMDMNNNFNNLPCPTNWMLEVKEVKDIPEFFRNIDTNTIIRNLLSWQYYCKVGDSISVEERLVYADGLLKNPQELISFIDMLQMEGDLKWELCNFINNPKSYYNEFANIIEKFLLHYEKLIAKHEHKMKEFSDYLEKKIEKVGVEYLKEATGDHLDLDKYDKISICTSFINPVTCSSYMGDTEIHLYLGIEYEEVRKKCLGENELEISLNIVKTLCDPIKFQILKCMKDKDVFGKEICEATGLSKASLSYHIEYLMSMNLIRFSKQGTKVYYSLKKEVIGEAIDVIKREFK